MTGPNDEYQTRQEIIDCLTRCARGVDRLDDELILSAYHADAIDHHGSFVGNPKEFVSWLRERHTRRVGAQHYLMNHVFDIDGDTAHVETYFMTPDRSSDRSGVRLVGGRYVDRFDRRANEWKIAVRVLVIEWQLTAEELPIEKEAEIGRRDRGDVSYLRPLESPAN
jgi:SnoaL-like domain